MVVSIKSLVVMVVAVSFSICSLGAVSVVVKKEKTPSATVLNQEASELVGEMLKTSAELIKELGELQMTCFSSLERVVNGEGVVTQKKFSTSELKKCVEELRSHKDLLIKAKEQVSSSRLFCSEHF